MLTLLPFDVQSRLRSDVAVTSVAQCVEEMVLNSLDAGAVCIAIRVDLSCFTVQVVDNGRGMSRDDLTLVGQRYSTSKCHKLEDLDKLEYFGYRGEALASLRDITSALEIHSRFCQSSVTFCKLFKHGRPLTVADSKYPRPCPGTTITAHNLFYNLPVRQQNIVEGLELERIRYRVEGIALMNPSVSISLRNDVTGNIILQTQRSNSVLTSFTYLFGGGLSKFLKPVSIQKGNFTIDGFISKDGHAKKNLQFVYVNGRLVLKTKVHKMVNKAMSSCILFKRNRKDRYNTTPNNSTVKYSDRYSVFVINVKCPYDFYDITFDPRKTLVEFKDGESLEMAVEEMVLGFLKKENLMDYVENPDAHKIPETMNDICTNEQAIDVIGASVPALISNEDAEISTFNTNNSLFSKTVRRQPIISCKPSVACDSSIENLKTPEVNIDVSLVLPSSSQTALEDAAEKLHLHVSPMDKEFTSDDEKPQKCPKLKYCHQVQSSSSSDLNSSKDSDDDLTALSEDPLLCIKQPVQKCINKTDHHNKTQRFEDDISNKYISLPVDRKRQTSKSRIPNAASNTERCMTAAEKISAKLKARKQIQSDENERITKVSSILDKFRKKSKPEMPLISIEQENFHESIVSTTTASHAAYSNDVQRMSGQSTSISSRSTSTLHLNQHSNLQFEINNRAMNTVTENRKRSILFENHSTEPKKLKYLTSSSFVMTSETALAELKSFQGEKPKTHPSCDKNMPFNCSGNALALSNDYFKKPLPVEKTTLSPSICKSIDSLRTDDIFSSTSFSKPCNICHLTETTKKSDNILPSKSSINSCDKCHLIETINNTNSGKPLLSSQGFKVNLKETDDETVMSGLCFQSSQAFEFNMENSDVNENTKVASVQSSEGFDMQCLHSEEKLDSESRGIDSEVTRGIENGDGRIRSVSASDVDEMPSEMIQMHEITANEESLSTCSEDSLNKIQSGQTKTLTIQSTADSFTVTDILSDFSEKSASFTNSLSGYIKIPKSEKTREYIQEVHVYNDQQYSKASEQSSESHSTSDYRRMVDEKRDVGLVVDVGGKNILDESITPDDQWLEVKDSNSGKKFYLNHLTGNSIYEDEWKKIQDNRNKEEVNKQTQIVKRKTDQSLIQLDIQEADKLHNLMSKHFDDSEDKYVKWRNSPSEEGGARTSIDDMFGVWENPVGEKDCQPAMIAEIQHNNKSGLKSHQALHQIRFTKDMLSCMQVLGQVDSKFIACVIGSAYSPTFSVPNLLVMMDQHAAHERVRLEQFTLELFEDNDDVVKRSVISPPIVLNLAPDIVRVMDSFTAEFDRIGIKFNSVENSRTEIHLHTIPACIMERDANEIKRGKRSIATQFVEELLTEHVEYLKNTSGSSRRLPISLHNILATKACKGAIKFNDNLSKKQCEELITALSKCDLPFQCAHGRPSIIPLFELEYQLKPKKEIKSRPRLDRLVKAMNNMTCKNQL